MDYQEIIKYLKRQANAKNVEGMARFGINPKNTLGISIPFLRGLAKKIRSRYASSNEASRDLHTLAIKLWNSRIHEARILASYIDEVEKVTEKQMDEWAADFDSWDTCDQVCGLFEETPYAYKKIIEWSKRKEEFVKRAAFALLAGMSVHNKKAPDSTFIKFFPIIKRESIDERNFVRKAVNWALRNIGKRNRNLNKAAIKLAREINKTNSKSAHWIAKDALRELNYVRIKLLGGKKDV